MGFLWFILGLICSSINDVLSKFLLGSMHPVQIACLRFFFGALTLLPFLFQDKMAFKTNYPKMQLTRGTILAIALVLWFFGMSGANLATTTLMSFEIPIFTLILAKIFLNEQITQRILYVTFFGFIGVIIALNPMSLNFDNRSIFLLISTLCFASLDIINKKFITQEKLLPMLFYSSFIAFLWMAILCYPYWQPVILYNLLLLFVIGGLGNLLLFCILKAFFYNKASELSPLRYLEVIFSAVAGYLLFKEIPEWHFYLGALIIIPSTFFILCRATDCEPK